MRYGFQPPIIVIARAMNPCPTVIPMLKIFKSATAEEGPGETGHVAPAINRQIAHRGPR